MLFDQLSLYVHGEEELTSNIESSHDDHTKDTEGFIPVIGTYDGSESEAGGVLSGLTSRYSESGEVVVRVKVQCFADLLSGLITHENIPG